MPDKSGFIQYKDKEIFYVDYTNIDNVDELRERIKRAEEMLVGSGKKDLLELVDVTGSYAESESIILLKESAKVSVPYIKRSAIVGVAGVKKVLLEFVKKFSGLNIEAKGSLEEAKEWLTRD